MALTTEDEAAESSVQHTKPCHDCPWRRKALPGWLGGHSISEWLAFAHGETKIDCHTVKGDPQPQCVGAAIYRANVLKLPRSGEIIRAKADPESVFGTPSEFAEHHASSNLTKKTKKAKKK